MLIEKLPAMNVYFTIDTESSLGGALNHPDRRPLSADRQIFCRIGGEDYGIGLITTLLSRYGFRGTFFVETLATLFNGDHDTRTVIDFLLSRGQDVQLHIHPIYYFYADHMRRYGSIETFRKPGPADFLGGYEEDHQMELLGQASLQYQRCTGYNPIAFRAGCFAANRTTLRCLKKLGIRADTSFNPCYSAWSFPGEELQPNRACQVEGVWEVPVTVARTPLPEGYGGLKQADPTSVSAKELRTMLETAAACGQRDFVIIFHSFSAVKAKDETYTDMRPDRIVIRRLERLFEYLHSRPDLYNISTFAEAVGAVQSSQEQAHVANLGLLSAAVRKSVQALNRYYWF
jgi:hypothetical protein